MDDAESLFGSPPPTPARARSPSPALALPGFSSTGYPSFFAQNVGTIALPGSHNLSELAVAPLALSLSHPPPRDAPRPPVQPTEAFQSRAPSLTRASSPPASKTRTRSRPLPKPVLRRTPPPLDLPGPSEPVPPNLLRNQPHLLGIAGVVGGVRSSHLPPEQGTSSSPIIVDPPERPRKKSSRSSHASDLDMLRLAPPSNREIIRALVEQGEVYKVLNDIMAFVADAPSRKEAAAIAAAAAKSKSPSPSRSRSSTPGDERSRKRRKLQHVPAGAHLWDVPFPFPEGEAPEKYHDKWEKQRGKKLITDLLNLIKSAAKKAALRTRLGQQEPPSFAEIAALNRHYNFNTTHALTGPEVFSDASNAFRPPPPIATPAPLPAAPAPLPDATLDQLITSLLSAPSMPVDSGRSTPDSTWDSTSSLDGGLFDSWMDIFERFPAPAGGFWPSSDSLESFSSNELQSNAFDFSLPTTTTFEAMDPALFALSTSNLSSFEASNPAFSGSPSFIGSPMPSSRSLTSELLTPITSELLTPVTSEGGYESVFSMGDVAGVEPFSRVDKGKGKEREMVDLSTSAWTETEQNALSYLQASMSDQARAIMNQPGGQGGVGMDAGMRDAVFSMIPTQSVGPTVNKGDVLRRAKARREHLLEEIQKTRIALWETTIEGGVLATLVHNYG